MCSSGTIIPPVAPGPRCGSHVVHRVPIDDLGVLVSVGRSLRGEAGERRGLLVVPRDQQRADLLDRDADRRRVVAKQRVAAGDEPRLERPWRRVEAGVQDRRVGLARSRADVGPGLERRRRRDRGATAVERPRNRRLRRRSTTTSYTVASGSSVLTDPSSLRPPVATRPAAPRPRPPRSAARRPDLGATRRQPTWACECGLGTQIGERGDAERGGVRRRVHLDRGLQQVGLGLQQQRAAGQPAVDPQPRQRRRRGRARRPGRAARPAPAIPRSRRARDGRARSPRVSPVKAAFACGFQYGAARPGERRHERDAARSLDRRAEPVEVGGLRHDAHVDQPA